MEMVFDVIANTAIGTIMVLTSLVCVMGVAAMLIKLLRYVVRKIKRRFNKVITKKGVKKYD